MADEAKIFMSVKILPDSIKKHLTGNSYYAAKKKNSYNVAALIDDV